jgi:hypothetical protein
MIDKINKIRSLLDEIEEKIENEKDENINWTDTIKGSKVFQYIEFIKSNTATRLNIFIMKILNKFFFEFFFFHFSPI